MPAQDTAASRLKTPGRTAGASSWRPRGQRRMPYRVPCRVRLVESTTGGVRTVNGQTLDISDSGVALELGVDVPVGTWVETLVPHPNGDPMFLCGRAIHSRRIMAASFEVGIEMAGDETSTFL